MLPSLTEVEMRHLIALILSAFAAGLALGQTTSTSGNAQTTHDENIPRIVGHSFTSNGAMEFLETLSDTIELPVMRPPIVSERVSRNSIAPLEFLETLSDTIGGRITGSPGSRQ